MNLKISFLKLYHLFKYGQKPTTLEMERKLAIKKETN